MSVAEPAAVLLRANGTAYLRNQCTTLVDTGRPALITSLNAAHSNSSTPLFSRAYARARHSLDSVQLATLSCSFESGSAAGL